MRIKKKNHSELLSLNKVTHFILIKVHFCYTILCVLANSFYL